MRMRLGQRTLNLPLFQSSATQFLLLLFPWYFPSSVFWVFSLHGFILLFHSPPSTGSPHGFGGGAVPYPGSEQPPKETHCWDSQWADEGPEWVQHHRWKRRHQAGEWDTKCTFHFVSIFMHYEHSSLNIQSLSCPAVKVRRNISLCWHNLFNLPKKSFPWSF